MRCRHVGGAILAVLGARWLWNRHQEELPSLPSLLPESTESLPESVQQFLKDFNLSDALDAELVAFRTDPILRPGLHPEAPKEKKHNVFIVPGVTSCGLEVWKPHPCLGERFFRRRVWGESSMVEALLSNWTCWLHHLQPDPVTGIDREGVRVRSAKGLRSSDYFIQGFWLWSKLIENLADIGYVEEDIHLACYDWRLAFPILEKRDQYFTGLRYEIEKALAMTGEKVVLIGHSMGVSVSLYFMKWVERSIPGWCDRHIASFVNIAGAILGAMSPLAAFVSGEMDATAAMGPFSNYMDSLALSFDEMRDIYWSFGGLGSMLPMGGSAVWGSSATGWTDTPVDTLSYPVGVEGAPSSLEEIYASLSAEDSNLPLRNYAAWTSYDRDLHRPDGVGSGDPRRLANPLATPLPKAPNMKIYCIYGVGQPTERAYSYGLRGVRWRWADSYGLPAGLPEGRIFHWSHTRPIDETIVDMRGYAQEKVNANRTVKIDLRGTTKKFANVSEATAFLEDLQRGVGDVERWIRINTSRHSEEHEDPWDNNVSDGLYAYGVAKADGDTTVPLVSLGYMCSHGWRDLPEFNPGNIPIYTKELVHDPSSLVKDARGGPATAKHLEIIGNHEVIMDILHIAAGNSTHLEQDRIISNLTQIGPIITKRIRAAL
mmetsp:Transcript_11433/g.32946  ORF Transcript_11433/g.32946 Transcript_11433/m.32946 type:complete len:657 (-) Transcript_11433:41-2011(-)